jgi:hypothetical protein
VSWGVGTRHYHQIMARVIHSARSEREACRAHRVCTTRYTAGRAAPP